MGDVGGLDPVEDHVHGADDVREGLLLLAEEGAFLEGAGVVGGEAGLAGEVLEGLAEEAGGADGAVVDALADAWLDDADDGADDGADEGAGV